MHESDGTLYDVAIIGAGVTGAALAYALARYTNVGSLILLERYGASAQVNSKSSNNSQTLHIGDIETNYSLAKARAVKKGADMILSYGKMLPSERRARFLFPVHKMALAVGEREVAELEKRFQEFHAYYPAMKKLDRAGIAEVEPKVIEGRGGERILALAAEGHAVNFGELATSLLEDARASGKLGVRFSAPTRKIIREAKGFRILLPRGEVSAKVVIVAAGSHSLLFAKMLGYGKELSIVPVGGDFYFTPEVLRGKVYTMQSRKLPFSAVHGDPDVGVQGKTRFGPTAKFFPVLERGRGSTFFEYIRSAGLSPRAIASFITVTFDRDIFRYLLRNTLYELPFVGKYFYVKEVRKIVPSMSARDLTYAKGFGGMRMQIIDIRTHALLLGEGQIVGDRIIFNMTPSPGASMCIANAFRDTRKIIGFFGSAYSLDEAAIQKDFGQ
jgi:malate dehydrogenase (quinone)